MSSRRLAWPAWLFIMFAGATSAQDPTEEFYWQYVDCEVEDQVSQYLKDYPQGAYVDEARACLEAIQAEEGGDDGDGAADGIAERLAQCAANLEARRLTSGDGGTALECYRAVLERDPGNADALAGLEEIEDTYAEWARSAVAAGDKARARRNLDKLKELNPEHPDIAALEQEVADSGEQARQVERRRQETDHRHEAAVDECISREEEWVAEQKKLARELSVDPEMHIRRWDKYLQEQKQRCKRSGYREYL